MIKGLSVFEICRKSRAAILAILGIVAGCSLLSAQSTANPGTAASIFKERCAICHAEDGSGTALGSRLHVRDLRAKEVQEKSTSELAQTIGAGKDNMPAFKDKLDDEQIQKLVEYIRHEISKSH